MSFDARDALSLPRNTARAIVIKSEDLFFLSEHDATVPAGNKDGFGLYFHDCRYLDGYGLTIGGAPPTSLLSTCDRGAIAEFEMTNAPYKLTDGSAVQQQKLGITLKRVIDAEQCAVLDLITVRNYDICDREVPLCLEFHSCFDDVFVIRGITGRTNGKGHQPAWKDGVLTLSYDGQDGIQRRVEVHADPKPKSHSGGKLQYSFIVGKGDTQQVQLSLRIREGRVPSGKLSRRVTDSEPVEHAVSQRIHDRTNKHAQFTSDNDLLNHVMHRSLLDIGMLRGRLEGFEYISAGLPWYGTLFGRDSIIAALQTLAFEPSIAEQTIRLLAKYQGDKTDQWRDEEPGKILHELRRGELANLNEIPQTPYYGAVDSTALFLILVGEHARWTGDLTLFKQVRPNVERALHWIDKCADLADNGYVSYNSRSKNGLGNQGWKDSGDAIVNADGSLATPPIALVEVQGYTFLAKNLVAELYSGAGDHNKAAELRKQATDLKERFNRDFWMEHEQFFALALQKDNRLASVISSNPGQALWTGIVDDSHARRVVQRLMAEDMFSGWGVRTLSTKEKRSNPIAYHLGTVWPHDNSILAAGMRRYGFNHEASLLCDGMLRAAQHFQHYRLPEVFAGFSQRQFPMPVRYPVACHPQAWAAGSVPFVITNLLGLSPDIGEGILRIVRPVLPKGTTSVQLRRLKVGKGLVDLEFRRTSGGVDVNVRRNDGNTEVRVDVQATTVAA